AAPIEHDPPTAVRLESPDRAEGADQGALGIPYRSRRQREVSRRQHLDGLGFPRERSFLPLEESRPGLDDRGPSPEGSLASEEDPFLRNVASERGEIPIGH